MMNYEQGFQNGLRIALIAIHRMQYEPEKAEFLEAIVNSAIAESEKRLEEYLKEMEGKHHARS